MGVRFACHGCAEPLNIKQELAGRRGICPKCGIRFRIPLADAPVSTPLETPVAVGSRASVGTAGSRAQAAGATASRSAVSSSSGGNSSDSGSSESGAVAVAAVASGGRPSAPSPTMESAGGVDPLGDPSISTWYVRPPSGGQYGPATTEVLRQWINEGRVSATALLWREGWAQWREAKEILAGLGGDSPSPHQLFTAAPEAVVAGRAAPSQPAVTAEQTLRTEMVGNAEIGKQRRERSLKRAVTIGVLSLVSLTLIIALVAVVRSSS